MKIPVSHYKEAEKICNSKTKLKKRLLDARSVLNKYYRPFFKKYTYDFEARRLYSECKLYFLQWYNNGQTTVGCVNLYQVSTPVLIPTPEIS